MSLGNTLLAELWGKKEKKKRLKWQSDFGAIQPPWGGH